MARKMLCTKCGVGEPRYAILEEDRGGFRWWKNMHLAMLCDACEGSLIDWIHGVADRQVPQAGAGDDRPAADAV